MNYNFTSPHNNEDSVYPQPKRLLEFSSQLSQREIFVKTVDEIFKKLQEHKPETISQLEWIYCISGKSEWDSKNPEISKETSALIWRFAADNSWLQRQLLWRLALTYSGQDKTTLASSFFQCFYVFLKLESVQQLLSVKIVSALVSNNTNRELSHIAYKLNLTPSELINKIRNDLPVWIPAFKNFIEHIVPYFCDFKLPTNQQVNWLLRCLNEMSSLEHQVNAVNYLLIHVSQEVASQHPSLVAWVKHNYSNAEKIYRLSEQARQKLREWIGAINYGDFQKLVNLILQRIDLQNFEANQLSRRSEFWSFYSNRFERIRILLPEKTFNTIGNEITRDVDILKNDGSEPTEICIFDFGDWFVVEFFRGKGSETRLFPNNPQNQQILFGQNQLSVKQIRRLGGDVHDHVYLWQYYCRQWLESKNIYPNPRTQPAQVPTEDKLRKRQKKLLYWKRDIKKLEDQTKEY
ncbi:MAG: EH signature domain-containing protein [Nostocaceae cyanobacterium]|nr:EH signature domain-containing protein [Nostocaceae cyanobacterium]